MISQLAEDIPGACSEPRAARRKGYIAPPQGKRKFEKYNTYIIAKLQRSASWGKKTLTEHPSQSAPALVASVSPSVLAESKKRYIPIVIPPLADQGATGVHSGSLVAQAFTLSTMSLPPASRSRTGTMDSMASGPSGLHYSLRQNQNVNTVLNMNGNQMKNSSWEQPAADQAPEVSTITEGGTQSTGPSPPLAQQASGATSITNPATSTSLSGLVCNVHRTTGKEPHPLVGASTTILGDKLYVFGGRILSRTKPQLTSDLYELDLIRRHWTRIETRGESPPPRYFHTVCALGDSKLVCYGGMSPAASHADKTGLNAVQQSPNAQEPQSEVVVLSDIHIYDVPTRTWMFVPTMDTPQGRYAHCATILPSSGIFASSAAPHSAILHNPSSNNGNPNQGSLGVSLDGTGGAEMVVVGGQDSANHYIEQTSVFNLRSLKWTATDSLGKSCGAYRSVVAPLTGITASQLGKVGQPRLDAAEGEDRRSQDQRESGSSMLIYSNYNFLDVKLELQIRLPDGRLVEKPMRGHFSPPGLRFPNGGVIDRHFVVSGTYLTSSKQEYALWALDLKSLTWSRIDAGGNHFSHGSWNRGVLWHRRNMFVVLGNRKRSLVEDYNHRRINFSNICLVELEAFGMYDNPRTTSPMSGFLSASAPWPRSSFHSSPAQLSGQGGGRPHSAAAERLGKTAMSLRELADMDFLAVDGERVPVNSALVVRRWGPYFNQLLREGATLPENTEETATLRPPPSIASRNSSITITPSIGASSSTSTTLTNNSKRISSATALNIRNSHMPADPFDPPTPQTVAPLSRSRTLYLPHTHLTLQTLVHFLYTSSLPPPNHPLCTPQILCSLLQLARPYQIDGLLEAVVERLHQVLDGRNAAAVFNAAAMAAGGGSATVPSSVHLNGFSSGTNMASNHHRNGPAEEIEHSDSDIEGSTTGYPTINGAGGSHSTERRRHPLRITTSFPTAGGSSAVTGAGPSRPPTATLSAAPSDDDDGLSSASTSASTNTTNSEYDLSDTGLRGEREVWSGQISSVVGLQKRGLRGLMEGRRMRERGRGQVGLGNAPGGGVAVAGAGTGTGTPAGVAGGLAPAAGAVTSQSTHHRTISGDRDKLDAYAPGHSYAAGPSAGPIVGAATQAAAAVTAAQAPAEGAGGAAATTAGASIGLGIA